MKVIVVGRKAQLHAEFFDVLQRIDAWRQDEEDWGGWARLLVRLGEFNASSFDVLSAELLFHKSPATCHQRLNQCSA